MNEDAFDDNDYEQEPNWFGTMMLAVLCGIAVLIGKCTHKHAN